MLNTGQLDTVVLLVVASQMMRGQAPKIFSPRTAPELDVDETREMAASTGTMAADSGAPSECDADLVSRLKTQFH